jgi:hypothetical protein
MSDTEAADRKTVENERKKLAATFLNNVAVTIVGTGLVAPFFAALYGLSAMTPEQVRFFGLAAPGWVILGGGIHFVARSILGGLKA